MIDGSTQDAARVGQSEISTLYSRLAPVYDIWSALTESKARDRALGFADLTDGETVLEIAVGTGLTLVALARANPHGSIHGIDISPGMLAKARRRIGRLPPRHNVEIDIGDAHSLPYEDSSFDLVMVSYLFDLLPEADFPGVVAELRRVVNDGGRVVATNMTMAQRRRDDVYRWVYRLRPTLLGGCRGVRLIRSLENGGFRILRRDYVSQFGFPSEVLLARPDVEESEDPAKGK